MKKWIKLILAIIVSSIAIIGISAYKYSRNSPLRISAEDAKARLAKKDFDVVLDVRTDMERKTLGLYPGSIHVPSGEIEARIGKEISNKGAKILVYCNTGQRARLAAEKMKELGYKNVVYISEGHGALM
jgi:phage shock protein E